MSNSCNPKWPMYWYHAAAIKIMRIDWKFFKSIFHESISSKSLFNWFLRKKSWHEFLNLGCIFFNKSKHADFSQGWIITHERGIKWMIELFDYYWKVALPLPSNRWCFKLIFKVNKRYLFIIKFFSIIDMYDRNRFFFWT